MLQSFRLPELIGLARSRLCRNMAIAVFTSIVLIEGAILIPSYRNYERDRLQGLDQAALTAVSAALAVGGTIEDAVELAARVSSIVEVTPIITGLALYLPDGTRVVAVGEVDGLAPENVGDGETGTPARIMDTARRHDVLWPPGRIGAPYVAVARLDATSVSRELTGFLLRIAGLVLVITVFVSGVTMVIVGRHVVEPILALRDSLSQAARDPARSSLFTLPADRNDELGEVFDAYNEMLDHVTNGIHQIAESKALAENLNRTLEMRVRERTSDLESAVEEARRANDALRQSEERFRRIFEESSDAVYLADLATGEIIDANREASRKLGYGREDLIGMQLSAIHPGQMRKMKKHLSRLSAGSRRPPILLPCRPKSGETFVLELSAAVFVLDGRRLMLALGRDSEERSRVERTLTQAKTDAEAASRAKTAFLANMSHELRTPLNAIIGFSEIMNIELFGRLGDTRYTGYAGDIVDSATHLLNIINDILDISKAEAGQLELVEDVVEPATIVEASCRLVDGLARRNGLTIAVEIDENVATIRVDARKLKQILVNLLSNAVKYGAEGGRVSVHVAMTPARELSITVIDDGPGMAEKDIPTALATFGQIDARFDRARDGTGLGLPLTKAFTELHGGEFRLESTPGEGTRAIVLLPAERVLGRRRMRDSA